MAKLNQIGLDQVKAKKLAEMLNDLLANYQVFYMNLRGFHWNVKGEKFFELHLKFEELYNGIILKIDEIAERILTLGFTPTHSYGEYVSKSEIKEELNVTDGKLGVQSVLDSFTILLVKQRQILDLSGEIGDEGTNAMASDYIREQEKLVWMLSAFLNK